MKLRFRERLAAVKISLVVGAAVPLAVVRWFCWRWHSCADFSSDVAVIKYFFLLTDVFAEKVQRRFCLEFFRNAELDAL